MKPIVVTGMGVLSTAGFSLNEFWDSLYCGKTTYAPIDFCRNNDQYRIKIGAMISSDQWQGRLPLALPETYGKASCYAVSTALQAIEDTGLCLDTYDKSRIAVVIGTTMGEIVAEEEITAHISRGKIADDKLYKQIPTFNIVQAVAESVGARGYLYAVPAACAAGNYALAMGKKLLDWNYADIVIVGGVDVFSKVAFAGFQRLLSLAPERCQPFDKNRKGLVLSEGCGIIIIEREGERQLKNRYGTVLGTGLSSNAYHMTAPHKDGIGEISSMKKAIWDANACPGDIDYVSAHGTGTKANDRTEAQAIRELFNNNPTPVSSIKSMLGHSMGAASILEIIASFLMIKYQVMLPTMHYETRDESCDLDVVPNASQKKKLRCILSNSFAFGGQTSSVLIGE